MNNELADCAQDFPALRSIDGAPVAYLDSAATTLKPQSVVEAMCWFLEQGTSAVHRGVHARSIEATDRFEATRERLARWFGADTDEIVFTTGATAAVNLVRRGWSPLRRVAVTAMEHHSNFVPWLDVERCDVIPVSPEGTLDLNALEQSLRAGVDLVAVTHVSNVLGTITDLQTITELSHRHGARVLVDAAQSASHHPPNVRELDLDFLVCSGHKMLGPSGCGALFVKRELYDNLAPVVLGGNMVDQVSTTGWTPQAPPQCYEAGTPAIESIIGWGAAVEYLQQHGIAAIQQQLERLTRELVNRLEAIPGLTLLGPTDVRRGPLASFHIDGLEAAAIAKILSQRDRIYVRSGFHCAQPLHEHLGLRPSVRASLQIYNSEDDLDRLARTLQSIAKLRMM
ncbi:aminotransferase class V-fold PLP-dependent enzyme [Roseimaritima ulvae]|uniref:cysteine desulfurase n=1 Tax=Roseimaritima ulvae TaxID=980254 RepID=A0A5B9QTZ4_9BACT|nr:cysteine desulfurase [Roseimaritima ulvae]QEG42508.1 putative cysteine desulfurase [Roseimaritima ulvae]